MNILLAALNAKYPHTNLAVRSVAAYAQQRGIAGIRIWERTINHRYLPLLRELAESGADVMIFSCYIWNIGLFRRLAVDLRKLLPETLILAAGPEAVGDVSMFDGILPGEGEGLTAAVLSELIRRRERGQPLRPFDRTERDKRFDLSMDDLAFPYRDLDRLEGRILYYESMRGCPFRCSYCLSSGEAPVRKRSLPLVFADLDRFLEAGVRQVKLVDRTFNCDPERARRIWSYLMERDRGVTNFHFELSGELLDDPSLKLLREARPGLFQFEIGVQSTHPDTLEAIRRRGDLKTLAASVKRLQEGKNIHLHLDLIAGLPLEDYETFSHSFNQVAALEPDQLQLGFLKVLRGSAMERDAARYGIVYQEEAPYQALRTNQLSFGELCRLQGMAEMVERYGNSGRFRRLLREVIPRFPSPFAFYEGLADFFSQRGYQESPPSKIGYYNVLGDFLSARGVELDEKLQWLCRYDLLCQERPKRMPDWVGVDGSRGLREGFLESLRDPTRREEWFPEYAGLEPKRIARLVHVERFPFHPETGAQSPVTLAFRYERRDWTGQASVSAIP